MVDYLAEAFKALDDVEDVMPCLHEEMFTVDSDGLSELADFEVESEKSEDKKRVIDPEAKNEEELKSSYVGKVIIDCNQCHSKIYKDKEDIVIDGEDANKEEECPYCFATEGFKVVGEVAPYTETKVDVEVEDKDTMTEGVRRRHRAAKKMGKKVVEEFNGSYHTLTIIDDLVDRAKLIYKEQSDPDISEAVMQAIDDGLIYYDDILELAGAYGVIDYGELVDRFVDDLAYDMGTQLESILAEEDDELKESIKGRINERKERANGGLVRGSFDEIEKRLDKIQGDFVIIDGGDVSYIKDSFANRTVDNEAIHKGFDFVEDDVYFDTVLDVVRYFDEAFLQEALGLGLDEVVTEDSRRGVVLFSIDIDSAQIDKIFEVYRELDESVNGRNIRHKNGENKRVKRINEAFYRGNKSIKFVYNGDYADPDLIYDGYTFNYYDIDEALWEDFLYGVEDGDIDVSFDREFAENHSDDDAVEDAFNLYVQENGVDYLKDVIYGGYFEKGSKSWHDRYKRGFAESKKSRHKGKLAESDHIRRRDVDSIPYSRKRLSGRVRKDLDIDEKKSDNPRRRDEGEKRARRIDRKVNSLKERKFDEDLGDDVAKYQRWVDYDMKRYGKISDKTKSYLDRAGLEVVKDDHDDYEVIAKDESLTEAPIYDLTPQFDTRRSFYNKARIDTGSDNSENKLYSYNTLVAEMIGGKPVVYNVQSGNTLRHVKEWLRQNGFKAETKSQIIRDYGVDDIVTESLEEVEVKTDTDKIKISSETITKDEEMAIPVTDETKDEIIADDDEIIADDEEEDTVDDIEEFDEESFDELSESYLKKVYSNVDGYKTSNVSFNKSGLCVEGIISFKSGNKKNTQFIFESRDNGKRFVGENKQITRGKKAFTVKGSIKDGKFITESFNYRYSAINPQTGKSENLYETLKRGK